MRRKASSKNKITGTTNKKIGPFVVILVFWVALFLFVMAGYSGSLGIETITGFAVMEDGTPTPMGAQSIAILILFFTNLVTMFFLIRERAVK
ncbi:MAG: hypothetical protein KAK00_09705 [Nanoarchaeota archaeon]|nr:hypothetical protein [Nanoarchaeota archaeon]